MKDGPGFPGSFPDQISMRTVALFLTTFVCFLTGSSQAQGLPEGLGIVYGKNHVFSLKAPDGWVLDNTSGVKQGLHAVFYVEDSSWKDADAVAYARARTLTEDVQTVPQVVEYLLADFHGSGNPDYTAEKIGKVETARGASGVLYHFTGDKWGNYEAVCYFQEKKTINFVVLSCRSLEAFQEARPSFLELCQSYQYVNDHYTTTTPEFLNKAAAAESNVDEKKE